MKKTEKPISNFTNIHIGTYGTYETLEEYDHRICEANGETYKPSELTETVAQYAINEIVKTDFASLTLLAKELYDCWGLSLIIETDGTLLIFDTNY